MSGGKRMPKILAIYVSVSPSKYRFHFERRSTYGERHRILFTPLAATGVTPEPRIEFEQSYALVSCTLAFSPPLIGVFQEDASSFHPSPMHGSHFVARERTDPGSLEALRVAHTTTPTY